MPDDRFIHRRAGHSAKVNMLTDLEYRVWTQYLLSADDFGVMRGTHHPLQNDNDNLAGRPANVIQRCLATLLRVGLIRQFEHQVKPYVYQHDWQSWQKVSYPRTTTQPAPPPDALDQCDETTRRLFALHPGGSGRTRKELSGNVPEIIPEDSALMRAGAPAERLTANGERRTANGSDGSLRETTASPRVAHTPIIARRRLDAAWEGPKGLYVPQRKHTDFIAIRNHPAAALELFAWYDEVADAWEGSPGADMMRFWTARFGEKWPAPAAAMKANTRPAWLKKAASV